MFSILHLYVMLFICCVSLKIHFILKCCCLMKMQKCPKYFCEPMVCNKWTGVVFKVNILSSKYGELSQKRRRMYFSFKCDWGESKKTPCDLWNRLLDQVTSHVQLYFVCFIFLFDIACSFSCVQWRACLQSAVCLVKPYLSKISPLSRSRTCLACPLLFCTLYAFHVQCFKLCWFYTGHAFSVYTWCCIRFPVHIV